MAVELTVTETSVELVSASAPGPAGPGVPLGGTIGQVLTKASGADLDTEWDDPGAAAPHAASHQDGGSDEISLTGLSGTPAALTTHEADTTSVHGIADTSLLATDAEVATAVSDHSADTTSVHGIADTSVLATDSEVATAVSDHSADTTSVHGIADTSALALTANHPSNATFDDHSARHENGGADEISLAGLDGTSAALQAHLDDTADAHDASAVSVADAGGYYTGTEVEAALQEVGAALAGTVTKTLIPAVYPSNGGQALPNWRDAQSDFFIFWVAIPSDYVSGDLTFKIVRRGIATGTAVMRKDSYRFRNAAAFSQIDNLVNINFAPGNTQSHVLTATIAAASIQAGDVIRFDITRLGSDGSDNMAGNVTFDGAWAEYTGSVT